MGAGRCIGTDNPFRIGAHESVRQMDDFFCKEVLLALRDDDAVCEYIVHIGCAAAASEAEINCLDRSWPERKNTRTSALGRPHQIDCDVDLTFSQHTSDLGIAAVATLNEVFESALQTPA